MSIFKRKKKEEKKDEQIKKSEDIKVVAQPRGKQDIKKSHGDAYKNLVRPIITEKVSFLGTNNQYVFEVSVKANKSEINKSIKSLYGISPIKVNIINVRGKTTRHGGSYGKRKNWKKAIITLKQGDKIDVYEGV